MTALDYEAHPSAVDTMRAICDAVAARSQAVRVAAVHRTGVAARRRPGRRRRRGRPASRPAFDAARDVIDTLKAQTPIWKHQSLGDGSTEWVGLP